MKRNGFILLNLLIILIPFYAVSQNKNILVTYDIYMNVGLTNKKTGILISNGNSSLFRQGFNISSKEDVPRDEFGNFYIDTQKHNVDIYVNQDSLSTMTWVENDLYKVNEKLPEIQWKLNQKKEKNINGFKSYQATCNFRGRKYTAWYTTEIPLDIGPWKFNGLPGLILEISENTNRFQWFVKEINYPYQGEITMLESKENEYIEVSLKKYVQIFENYKAEMQKRMAARAPQGSKLTSSEKSRGIELIYEWEKE